MSDPNDQVLIFDKDQYRKLKNDLQRFSCRKLHVEVEMLALNRKLEGLKNKLDNAQISFEHRSKALAFEVAELDASIASCSTEIKVLNNDI